MTASPGHEDPTGTPSPKKKRRGRKATLAREDGVSPRNGRERGFSFEKVLTAIQGSRKRTISKEDISRPIPDDRYPIIVHSPLIPLGQVSQSPSPPYTVTPSYFASPTPLPREPQHRSAHSAPSNPTNTKRALVRWNSAPTQGIDGCYIAPSEPSDILNWLSDPRHSHAYPKLQVGTPRLPDRHPSPSALGRDRAKEIHLSQSQLGGPRYIGLDTPPSGYSPLRLPDSLLSDSERSVSECASPIVREKQRKTSKSSKLSVQRRLDIASKKLSRISEASQEAEYTRPQKCTLRLLTKMNPMRTSLQPPANAGTKVRAIQQAKEMESLVAERAKRTGEEPPPYDFLELIGKGAYGRVFKGRSRATGGLVAIKVIDTDKTDYEEMTTKNLQETLREINILQQVKESRARPYVIIIEEARTVHNELWIVSEYASGGSVSTLMKPRLQTAKAGLEEKYIIPIARELAMGLKYIHEAGVIHRDLKCNNVLINEEGRVQLCDFGVSGALEPEVTKRSTIVGTPNWMAPELKREWVKDIDPSSRARPNEILYGSEVDIWAYGCTLYEMATGLPPFHTTQPFLLPEAGVPRLEGDQYSEELKSLVDFVLQPNPRDRPTPDEILEHPYLADTTKMYPTVTLVALVEQYYRWEQAGGSRISLFNPYGAQAPDPLAPEVEDDDDDWTFSTTDEFERQFASENPDPLSGATTDQAFNGMNVPPQDEDRFARLQASIRQEQAERGKKRLDRLFDTNSTPYRFSAMDPDSQRLSSDLVLRDFNPGAPNRETVIDLDFAAPSAVDVPSIDLGEVPTVKASRINRLMREMDMEDEEEYRDGYDMDQTARRATREWKFPDQSNRKTAEWKFPIMEEPPAPTRAVPEKTNRRTMEWKFDYSSIEANQEPMPRSSRISVRRDTRELNLGAADANRRTQDFVFPMRDPSESTLPDPGAGFSSSPTLEPGFRPTPRHATTEPVGSFDDYPRIESAPNSPLRTSMIDLDMANVDDYRPSTSGSAATSAYTAGGDQMTGNPFDLEDQVQLSETNNRASFHMKSQSEPNHAIPGLLTPQTHDEQGNLTNADPHHPSMHARGVSSASQMQSKPPSINMPYSRQRNQLQPHWDGWNQQEGPNTQQSSPASASPATSAEDEFLAEERWNELEKEALNYKHGHFSGYRHRLTTSQDDDLRSDMEDNYASESSYDVPSSRMSRVSVGPNGRPLVDFPMPRGPDPEALFGVNANLEALSQALLKSSLDMREGLRASRDLLRGMRLADVGEQGNR